MNMRSAKLTLALLATALLATGCSTNVVSATPTPVDYKACMSVSPAGLADGGLNQNAYFGLQQAVVQYGVSISATEAAADESVGDYQRRIDRLIKRGCNLIFAVGGNQNAAVYSKAKAHTDIRFVLVDQPQYIIRTMMRSGDYSNVTAINYDTTTAAFQAGYLAAAHSSSKVVGVISGTDDKVAQAEVWYFMQGVEHYNLANPAAEVLVVGASGAQVANWWSLPETASPKLVKRSVGHLLTLGVDTVFAIGVNGLAAAQEVALKPGAVLIGSDSDWFTQDRYSTVKNLVLASIHKVVSADIANLVGKYLVQSQATTTPTATPEAIIAGVVKLSPQHAIEYGSGIQGQLDDLSQQISAGQILVTPFIQ